MKIYTEISPCRDCERREVGCHSACIDYINWKASGREQPKPFYSPMRKSKNNPVWNKFYRKKKI